MLSSLQVCDCASQLGFVEPMHLLWPPRSAISFWYQSCVMSRISDLLTVARRLRKRKQNRKPGIRRSFRLPHSCENARVGRPLIAHSLSRLGGLPTARKGGNCTAPAGFLLASSHPVSRAGRERCSPKICGCSCISL